MEEGKDIELRSDSVQEVMSKVPPGILRWGITVLSIILLMLLTGSYFFKYPETIEAEIFISCSYGRKSVIYATLVFTTIRKVK